MALLTRQQAAERLGVSWRTLDRLRHDGEGPEFVPIGRQIRYKAEDLDAWVDAQKQPQTETIETGE